MFRIATIVLLSLLSAVSAFGNTEMILRHGDVQLDGGEVCFFKIAPAAGSIAPETFFFASRDVHCVPAQKVLEIPAGRFLFFGRHRDGFVTPHRSVVSQPEPDSEEGFKGVQVPVVPSATLDFSALSQSAPDSYFGVWVEDGEQTQSTFLPALPGETSMLVPAGMRIIPMEIASRTVVRLGVPVLLKRGERVRLDSWPRADGYGDVVTWLEGADRDVMAASRHGLLQPPGITLVHESGEVSHPVLAAEHFGGYHGTLVIFRNVRPGRATARVEGRWWLPDQVDVEVRAGRVSVTGHPLRFEAAGVVHAEQPVFAKELTYEDECDAASDAPVARVTLRQCPGPDADPAQCTSVVAEKTYDPRAGDGLDIPSVRRGEYALDLHLSRGLAGVQRIRVEQGMEVVAKPDISALVLYGTVRRGGGPLRARLTFGTGESTVTDERGAYRIAVRKSPEQAPVQVNQCESDDWYVFVPERPATPYEAFDIAIPDNALTVHVRHAVSGKPIVDARARASVRPPSTTEGSPLFTRSAVTDADGIATIDALPPGYWAMPCATATGYERACADPVTVPRNGKKKVEIEMREAARSRGRVAGFTSYSNVRLYFLSSAGMLVGESTCSDDGTFEYNDLPHDAYVVVTSPHEALMVLGPLSRPPAGEELIVTVPRVATRSFRVRVDRRLGRDTARIGLIVGGIAVPLVAFARHQSYRGLQPNIVGDAPLEIRDIGATGTIAVRLGPAIDDPTVPPDAVTRPTYAGVFPSRVLGEGESEVFFGEAR